MGDTWKIALLSKKLINYCIIYIEYKKEKNDQYQMKKKKDSKITNGFEGIDNIL